MARSSVAASPPTRRLSWPASPPRRGHRSALMTPGREAVVGPASFEGIVGAPVLTDEFERDPTRGAFPGDPVPEHDPIGHLRWSRTRTPT